MWVPRSFPAGPLSPPPPLASPSAATGAVPGQGRLLPPRGSLGMSWGAPSIRSPTLSISVLVAKGRARVGVAAAATDWPKRIRDLQFSDHEGDPTAT